METIMPYRKGLRERIVCDKCDVVLVHVYRNGDLIRGRVKRNILNIRPPFRNDVRSYHFCSSMCAIAYARWRDVSAQTTYEVEFWTDIQKAVSESGS